MDLLSCAVFYDGKLPMGKAANSSTDLDFPFPSSIYKRLLCA